MSINLKYEGVVVHKWVFSNETKRARVFGHVLERQDKTLERLFDKLQPLVQGGATLVMEQRVVNVKPVAGKAYDVIDITVTQ